MTATDYRPVECGLHSRYELAVMRGQRLALRWREQETLRFGHLLPIDLLTRDGAEYLRVRDVDGEAFEIRLDRLIEADGLPGSG